MQRQPVLGIPLLPLPPAAPAAPPPVLPPLPLRLSAAGESRARQGWAPGQARERAGQMGHQICRRGKRTQWKRVCMCWAGHTTRASGKDSALQGAPVASRPPSPPAASAAPPPPPPRRAREPTAQPPQKRQPGSCQRRSLCIRAVWGRTDKGMVLCSGWHTRPETPSRMQDSTPTCKPMRHSHWVTHRRRSWRPVGVCWSVPPRAALVSRTSRVPGSLASVSTNAPSCMLARRRWRARAAAEAVLGVPWPEPPAEPRGEGRCSCDRRSSWEAEAGADRLRRSSRGDGCTPPPGAAGASNGE